MRGVSAQLLWIKVSCKGGLKIRLTSVSKALEGYQKNHCGFSTILGVFIKRGLKGLLGPVSRSSAAFSVTVDERGPDGKSDMKKKGKG